MKEAKKKYDDALESLESENRKTSEIMDVIGNTELRILKSFEIFTDIFEKFRISRNSNPFPKVVLICRIITLNN